MRPGITVQHVTLPQRRQGLVRCDVVGVIAFIRKEDWPENAQKGDFVELVLKETEDLWGHPLRHVFSELVQGSVAAFFENGGELCHLFGVCHTGGHDVRADDGPEGSLNSLMYRLRTEEDIALLIVPEASTFPLRRDASQIRSLAEPLLEDLLAHCKEMGNRFLILDPPRGLHEGSLERWFTEFKKRSVPLKSYGALYYPWFYRGETLQPPSGAIAGLYARVEREHGVFGVVWPPANHAVRGVTRLEVELDWSETAALAELAINPLVVEPGRGVVVWGARTMSDDPSCMHINSRRVVSMVREQLRRDNEWAVFEPNDENVWTVLERDVAVRLEEFWRAGLITGETRHGDYEVKCDDETNPPDEREAGRMNVRLRFRPIGTTEHITIDLRLGDTTE
jgi:hypothetical protein